MYITGDRRNLETQIGMDIFPFLNQHLASGRTDKIDLFLYSLGGDAMASATPLSVHAPALFGPIGGSNARPSPYEGATS